VEPSGEAPSGEPSSAPSGEPSASASGSAPPPEQPPLIVAKVADQGTATIDDDKIVGGATFEMRLDDGDGTYEPDGADGPVLATVDATHGFAIFHPTSPGHYWITEVAAPTGLATSDPVLITYSGSDDNCGWYRGEMRCVADDDGVAGFVIVAFKDPPTGSVEAAQGDGNLPATDTAESARPEPAPGGGTWAALLIVFIVSLAAFSLTLSQRRPRTRSSSESPRD
jgi:hypothetical protein